jgi:hypothetical protein
MRRAVAVGVATLALAGCGSGQNAGHQPSASTRAGAAAFAAWGDAAARFNAEFHQCLGRISPIRGFWAACIDAEHRRYESASGRTLGALQAVTGTGPACAQSRSTATHVVTQLQLAWRQASLAMGRMLRAVDTGRAYGGPAPAALQERADREYARNARLVPGLVTALRRACA